MDDATQDPRHELGREQAATIGQEHTATVGNVPVRWYEGGDPDGTPVVLVHGIPTSPVLWRDVVPLLTAERVLSLELVGYGRGAGAGDDLSVEAQAVYLLALLRHLGIERAVLVGHDLGGGVVQTAAVRDPARCAGLVVVDGVCYDAWPIPQMKVVRALAPVVARLPGRLLAPLLQRVLASGHRSPEDAARSVPLHVRPYRESGGAPLARQAEALDVRDTMRLVPHLPGLGPPAAVVWGEDDPFLGHEFGERLARDLDAPFTLLAGHGHWTPESAPEDVAAAVLGVLQRGSSVA